MTTLEKIKKIIAEQIRKPVEEIKDDSRLVEDLNIDSLDMVELLMAFEEEFGTSISDELAMQLKTVNDIVNLVEKN